MAKGRRLSGQVAPLTEEEKAAAREAEVAKIKAGLLDQANTAGTLGLEGQDTGPQEGPPIALPSETIAEDLRNVQVTPQESQLATQVETEATPEATPQPQQTPIAQAVSQANQEKFGLTPEQQIERENIRVPSVMEAAGVARDRLNLRNQIGDNNADRFDLMAEKSDYTHPVTMSVTDAIQFDPVLEVSDPGFQEGLEVLDKEAFEVEDKGKRPLRVNTQGAPLRLNRSNILLSNKVLGIGIKNPNFDPTAIKLNDKGGVANYEGANQQPFILDTRYIPTIAAVIEDMLVKTQRDIEFESGANLDQPPLDIEMDSVDPTAAEVYREQAGRAALGRSLFQAIRREKAYFAGEPTDTYMDDFKNTTPETFEAIGEMFLDYYATVAPHMVTVTKGTYNTGTGEATQRSYALSPEAYIELQESRVKVPDFKAKFLTMKPELGTIPFEGMLLKTETGVIPTPKSQPLVEAKINASQVTNVIDGRRGSLALMLGVHAYATAVKKPEANIESANFTLNAMDMGPARMNKIRSIYATQKLKRDIADEKIKEIDRESELSVGDSIRRQQLEAEKLFREDLMKKYELGKPLDETGTNELQALYYQHANKNLETLNFIARNGDAPFYHTFVTQKGSQRLTTAQYLSFQNSHLMRNVIGSGAKVEIKPLRGGEIEDNFLWSASTIFFGGGGKLKEAAISDALFNIKEKTPTYQNVVKLGGRLKEYLGMFDKEGAVNSLKNLKTTPQGISGLNGLNGTLPQPMLQDKELMTFLEALSNSKDSHKHMIQHLDYMMAMAEYDQAMKDGTSFHTSVNGVEIDGISNGLASFFVMLGQYNKLPRIGVTRAEGSEEVLGMWKDLPNVLTVPEAYAGDIRETLAETLRLNMGNEVSSLAMFDRNTMEEFGYSEQDIPKLRKILEIALKKENKATFLKAPILTFPYGQETKNLIGSIYETIVADPELYKEIESFFGNLPTGARFLDMIRMQALRSTLGYDVMLFSNLAKAAVDFSSIYNRYMSVTNPAGGESMFVGKETKRTERTVDLKATSRRDKKTGRAKPLIAAMERQKAKAEAAGDLESATKYSQLIKETKSPRPMEIAKKKSFLSPLTARRGISGGVAHGSVLPNIAQGLDGATVIKTFSGPAWNALSKTADGEPWVLPVYDAFITDLRSMGKMTSIINSQWFNMTSETTIIDEMVQGLDRNVKQGRKIFSKLAQEGGVIDEAEHGALADHVVNMLTYAKLSEEERGEAQSLIQALTGEYVSGGVQTKQSRNYQNLYSAQLFLEQTVFFNTQRDITRLAQKSKEGRAKIRSKVKADKEGYGHEVLQYAMDDIGLDKSAMALLDT
jgi:hypothetical protein